MRWFRALVFLWALSTSTAAGAATLETLGGEKWTGVVEQVEGDDLIFLWQKSKDQPEEVRRGKGDFAFQAQGHQVEARRIPIQSVARVDGVLADRFPALFGYNLFFRIFQVFQANIVRASAQGTFVAQVKSMVVLMAGILLLVPALLLLASMLLPGERLGVFGAVVFSGVLTVLGFGVALGMAMATAKWAWMGSPGAQVASSILVILVAGAVIHTTTRHSFWQGLAFLVAWGASLVLSGRLGMMLMGAAGLSS